MSALEDVRFRKVLLYTYRVCKLQTEKVTKFSNEPLLEMIIVDMVFPEILSVSISGIDLKYLRPIAQRLLLLQKSL